MGGEKNTNIKSAISTQYTVSTLFLQIWHSTRKKTQNNKKTCQFSDVRGLSLKLSFRKSRTVFVSCVAINKEIKHRMPDDLGNHSLRRKPQHFLVLLFGFKSVTGAEFTSNLRVKQTGCSLGALGVAQWQTLTLCLWFLKKSFSLNTTFITNTFHK